MRVLPRFSALDGPLPSCRSRLVGRPKEPSLGIAGRDRSIRTRAGGAPAARGAPPQSTGLHALYELNEAVMVLVPVIWLGVGVGGPGGERTREG